MKVNMKKLLLLLTFIFSFSLFAQNVGLDGETDLTVDPLFQLDMPDDGVSEKEKTEVPDEALFSEDDEDSEDVEEEEPDSVTAEEESIPESKASKGGISQVPAAKRPKKADSEKVSAAAEKDENENTAEEYRNTIKYGIPSEISELVDNLIKNEDPRFSDELYDVFQTAKNNTIKEKILTYFTKLEDPCLEDYAVNLLNDPYDESGAVVKACFQYISAVKTKAAIPAVISLIEGENENYFNDAIAALGEIGGADEAVFLMVRF